MIRVRNISKSFNGQTVLDNIDLDIADGEILVILGESGAGKSVLLQHLVGLFHPDRGMIEINGKDITKLSERELLKIRRGMGYLFQQGALYDFMTVAENVAFPLTEHARLKAGTVRSRVAQVLRLVGLEEAAEKYPAQLSGGMKKRAALARSIIMDSKILLCDEPTSGLDPIRSRDISDLIAGVSHQLKCTTIVASHDIVNSFRIADRLALIRQGKIVARGTRKELEASRDPFIQEFLK